MAVAGLAFLDLDRVRALEGVHASGVHEDDLVAYYEYCRFGHGGAVPSIDTPLHAFIVQDHVDHLHPDSMIALAAAEGSEALVAECYGAEVGWLPWKRPGFDLGLALRDLQRRAPEARGAVLEGHGMICWADSSEACEALSLDLIARAERFLADRDPDAAFGAVREGFTALPDEQRRRRATALAPIVRGVAASERPMVGAFSDAPVVLDFLSREAAPRLAAQGTSCPDHFLRTKVRPLYLDLPATATLDEQRARLGELHDAVPGRLPRLLRRLRRLELAGDARRRSGDRPRAGRGHVELRPRPADGARRRRVLHQRDQRDARGRGGVQVLAHRRPREVPHRVLGARGAQAADAPGSTGAAGSCRPRHRSGVGDRTGDRRAAVPARSVCRRRRPRRRGGGEGRRRPGHRTGARPRCRRVVGGPGRGNVRRRRRALRRGRHRRQQRRVRHCRAAHRHDRRGLGPSPCRARSRGVPRQPRRRRAR